MPQHTCTETDTAQNSAIWSCSKLKSFTIVTPWARCSIFSFDYWDEYQVPKGSENTKPHSGPTKTKNQKKNNDWLCRWPSSETNRDLCAPKWKKKLEEKETLRALFIYFHLLVTRPPAMCLLSINLIRNFGRLVVEKATRNWMAEWRRRGVVRATSAN